MPRPDFYANAFDSLPFRNYAQSYAGRALFRIQKPISRVSRFQKHHAERRVEGHFALPGLEPHAPEAWS